MDKKYLQINNIDAYIIAFNLSNIVWKIVSQWSYFEKDTLTNKSINTIHKSEIKLLTTEQGSNETI